MTSELSNFAARLREFVASSIPVAADVRRLNSISNLKNEPPHVGCYEDFNTLALELFALQFAHNAPYRRICQARKISPKAVQHWTQIPAVPTTAFKELELTSLPPELRTQVFHSSGTTEQRPSRHFHNAESLAVYEASLWPWFARQVLADSRSQTSNFRLAILTPTPAQAPDSSLVHMVETVRRELGASPSAFAGSVGHDGSWTLDFDAALTWLQGSRRREEADFSQRAFPPPHVGGYGPLVLLGTAFSFVHLLDFLAKQDLCFNLPPGSRVMETGGYKGRSRSLPKTQLHALITARLGIPPSHIVCEYGMSELSSQAYDKVTSDKWQVTRGNGRESCHLSPVTCHFHFPPWSRAQIISPETGREVSEGETGLIRVFDLANVFSVMAIQTEDMGIRHGDGFELIGRATLSEPRGCSLLAV